MPNHILITGASGLIGTRLTQMLLEQGHTVSHLSRSVKRDKVPVFQWNINDDFIDPKALEKTDTIIHLAGASVADKRWNESYKKEISESRIQSSRMLFEKLKNSRHNVSTFISASAIGYYGFTMSDHFFTEESEPGKDFLAQVTKNWEDETDKINSLGIRVVKIRIGIVLSKTGGALKKMVKPIKWFVGSPLASGNQYISWIHIDDLCGIFMKAVNDSHMKGIYNGVAPCPVTNGEMTQTIAAILKKPLWMPNVPAFVLRIVMGEMAEVVIEGSNVSSRKIENAGYQFKYSKLEYALADLLR